MAFRRLCSGVLYIIFLGLIGCGPALVQKPAPPVDTGLDRFSAAEKRFQQGDYEAALAQYAAVVQHFPDAPFAPAALMKMGRIYELRNDFTLAYNAYERILSAYPDTVYAPDAGVEMLSMLYRQENYIELIQQSSQLPSAAFTPIHIMRISTLVGDAFVALDAPVEAAYAYVNALGHASSPLGRQTVMDRLESVVSALSAEDLHMLSLRLKDPRDVELVQSIYKEKSIRTDTIGCLLPLSGAYEVYGNRALKGIEMALNRFSEIRQINYNIIVKDTRSDAETARNCVLELVEEKAACIIGPIATADSAAAAAQENGIPMIALSHMDGVPEAGDFVFRNFITPGMQVETLVSYAVNELGARRFAILYPKEKYGVSFMNYFWEEVLRNGGEVVGAESYELDQTDFEAPIRKLAGSYYDLPEDIKPGAGSPDVSNEEPDPLDESNEEDLPTVDFDALFLPDAPKKAGLIIPQLLYYDVENVVLLGTNLWHSDELIKMAGRYAQNAVLTEGFFVGSRSALVKAFVSDYRNTYGEDPGFIEAVSYDTAMMLFTQLAENTMSLRSEVKDALARMPYYEGVTGLTAFTDTGEARKRLYLLKIRNNRFLELEY
ncbi:MAG: penicillin-binding protein activator [Desulfobacterales bacterium]